MQVRVTSAGIPVGAPRRHQAPDVDLAHTFRAGPREQGMLLDQPQRIGDRPVVRAFDDRRHAWIGRTHNADTDFTGGEAADEEILIMEAPSGRLRIWSASTCHARNTGSSQSTV